MSPIQKGFIGACLIWIFSATSVVALTDLGCNSQACGLARILCGNQDPLIPNICEFTCCSAQPSPPPPPPFDTQCNATHLVGINECSTGSCGICKRRTGIYVSNSTGINCSDQCVDDTSCCTVVAPTPGTQPSGVPGQSPVPPGGPALESCSTTRLETRNECGPVGYCGACERRIGVRRSTPAGNIACSDVCIRDTSCNCVQPVVSASPQATESCIQTSLETSNECGPVGTCGVCQRRVGVNKSTPSGAVSCSDVCVPDTSCNCAIASPPPQAFAQCRQVKVYKLTGPVTNTFAWRLLTVETMTQLRPGETIYLTTYGGSNNTGIIDKARIRVNSATWSLAHETSLVKSKILSTDPTEFYVPYVIPQATRQFTVEAEVHELQRNLWY